MFDTKINIKTKQSKKSYNEFLTYQNRIFEAKKTAFLCGYDLIITEKGFINVYEYDGIGVLKKFENLNASIEWILKNRKV